MVPSINPYSREILKKNIFKNINSFYELEKRIANTGSIGRRGIETTKGDIFEIFIEALLSVNKKYQKSRVYPSFATPTKIKNELSISLIKSEMGFDGVYVEKQKVSTYQVKYRNSVSGTLTWKDLSTFIGVSEKAHKRHLFTNINKISNEFSKKQRVVITSRKDLIKLKDFEFKEIENWLYQKKTFIKKHKPENFQKKAIKDIVNELKIADKTTAIMACGTGKTNIALWVYEKMKPKTSIVFVPSIALVKQIRADWLEQISFKNIRTLQVCSVKDTSRREDELKLTLDEIDFEITTNKNEIKNYLLKKNESPTIIFCTYQSSKALSLVSKSIKFDFAVFDEAHRTARSNLRKQDEITGFNFPLYDNNIKISKRLFLTATRRISNPLKIYKTGDPKLTLSMENENLYGKICHSLSFKKAADIGAIAKFKILLSFVTSNEVTTELRKKSSTIVKDNEINTEQVAKQIAIKKAVEKNKIKKIFTFHNSVDRAKSFCSNSAEGIGSHLENFYSNSIYGTMKMHQREEFMEDFKLSKKAILSNARCLIEGVDVPAVEMVAFIDNKNSPIDIVQATGRALRNRGVNKKYGFILIPIFVEQFKGEKISEALQRTQSENLTQILRAIKEHDDEVAQLINDTIYESKRRKGYSDRVKRKISEIIEGDLSLISQDKLIDSIINKSFDRVKTGWDEKIVELKLFYEKYNHWNFTEKENRALKMWVDAIRRKILNDSLFYHQIQQLKEIGFPLVDERVDIEDVSNYYTINKLSEKHDIPSWTLRLFEKHGFIKKVGKGKVKGKGKGSGKVANFYNDINLDELLKNSGLTKIKKEKGDYTLGELEKLTGYGPTVIEKYLKDKKLKPSGRAIITGPTKHDEEMGTSVYEKITREEITKHFDYDLSYDNSYPSLFGLSKQVDKELNLKISSRPLIQHLKNIKKIIPLGKIMETVPKEIYPKYTTKQLIEFAHPYVFHTQNLATITIFCQKFKIVIPFFRKHLLSKKKITRVGYKYKKSNKGKKIELYDTSISKDFIEEKLGFKLSKPKNSDTLSGISTFLTGSKNNKKLIETLYELMGIKPICKAKHNNKEGFSEFYEKISKEDICRKLKIDFIIVKNDNYLSKYGIVSRLIDKHGVSTSSKTVVKILTNNNIKPVGYAIVKKKRAPLFDMNTKLTKLLKHNLK